MIDILTLGDEVLHERAKPIETFGPEVGMLADAMFETMEADRGIGLAGPQIGVLQRIFVVEIEGDQRRVFINPEIIETSLETVSLEEGCLSIPGIYTEVTRPAEVTVQARGTDGKPFTLTASGMLARVIQHENDHLNGVLFIDRLPAEKRDKMIEIYEKKNYKRKKTRV